MPTTRLRLLGWIITLGYSIGHTLDSGCTFRVENGPRVETSEPGSMPKTVRTVQEAVDLAARLRLEHDHVIICLDGGIHYLTSPISLGANLSSTTWIGTGGEVCSE